MKVKVRCPACGKIGNIEISGDIIKNNLRGIYVIVIPANTICSDSFIAYIDNNLKVRDTILTDFQVDLPDITIEKSINDEISYSEEILDLDLIKLNLTPTLLTYVLKSIFCRKKVVLILDEPHLYIHISNFFNYITLNSFETDIAIISKDQYREDKKIYKKHVILEGKEVKKDKDKIIDLKKILIERKMIQNFFAEYENDIGCMILRNEIQKAFQLSKFISEFIVESGEKGRVDITEISDNLQRKYSMKASSRYLDFLMEIVENYFHVAVPSSQKLLLKLAH